MPNLTGQKTRCGIRQKGVAISFACHNLGYQALLLMLTAKKKNPKNSKTEKTGYFFEDFAFHNNQMVQIFWGNFLEKLDGH